MIDELSNQNRSDGQTHRYTRAKTRWLLKIDQNITQSGAGAVITVYDENAAGVPRLFAFTYFGPIPDDPTGDPESLGMTLEATEKAYREGVDAGRDIGRHQLRGEIACLLGYPLYPH